MSSVFDQLVASYAAEGKSYRIAEALARAFMNGAPSSGPSAVTGASTREAGQAGEDRRQLTSATQALTEAFMARGLSHEAASTAAGIPFNDVTPGAERFVDPRLAEAYSDQAPWMTQPTPGTGPATSTVSIEADAYAARGMTPPGQAAAGDSEARLIELYQARGLSLAAAKAAVQQLG